MFPGEGLRQTDAEKTTRKTMPKNKNARVIPATVLALMLVLTGCPVGGGTTPIPELTIALGGKVYSWYADADGGDAGEWVWWERWNPETREYERGYEWVPGPDSAVGGYVRFNGRRNLSSFSLHPGMVLYDLGGEGSISDGLLNFNIGRPRRMWGLGTLSGMIFEGYQSAYRDFAVYPAYTRGAVMYGLTTAGDGFSGWVYRTNHEEYDNTSIVDDVFFLYADRNATLTGRGMTLVNQSDESVWKVTTMNVNIALNAGWNVLHRSHTTTIADVDGLLVGSETVTLSASDPGWVNWILREEEGDAGLFERRPRIARF